MINMELMKKASETSKPRKRPLDDNHSKDCDLEKFRVPKQRVQAVRDFPPGCGIQKIVGKPLKMSDENDEPNNCRPKDFGRIKGETGPGTMRKVQFLEPNCSKTADTQILNVITNVITEKKAQKHLDSADKDVGINDKSVYSKEYDGQRRIKLAEFKENKPSFGKKPAGKVKFWDPREENQPKVTSTDASRGKPFKNLINVDKSLRKLTSDGDNNKPSFGSKVAPTGTSVLQKELIRREKIKEAMKVFDQVYTQLFQDNRVKPKEEKVAHWRVPQEAAKLVQRRLKWMTPEKRLGSICGVRVGDTFRYRSQLKMIGLHFQHQSGIDYANIKGKNLAISIVDAQRYSNKSGSSDELIYSGHGGLKFLGSKLPAEDQKLERGNLALKNSKDEKNPVRVIRKVDNVFVYDGLYEVKRYTQERSEEGKFVFKFHLERLHVQPSLHQKLTASW